MSKLALKDFKRFWLNNYIEQYKESDVKGRKEIKNNVYKNTNLTDDEKDQIWETIIEFGLVLQDLKKTIGFK